MDPYCSFSHGPHVEREDIRGAAEDGEDLKGEVGLKLARGREQGGGEGGVMCRGNYGQRPVHLESLT